MGGQRSHARAVSAGIAARKVAPATKLCTQFDELIGWCNPGELQAVVPELRTEVRLVGQWIVSKVPRVGVLLVEVTDTRKETARLQ